MMMMIIIITITTTDLDMHNRAIVTPWSRSTSERVPELTKSVREVFLVGAVGNLAHI